MAEGTGRKRVRKQPGANGERYRRALAGYQCPTNRADEKEIDGELQPIQVEASDNLEAARNHKD